MKSAPEKSETSGDFLWNPGDNKEEAEAKFKKISEAYERMMALYIASHYKNSPNDLQLMADAPAHHLFKLQLRCLSEKFDNETRRRLVYQYTKKRASGSKCPVTGKKIQGILMREDGRKQVCIVGLQEFEVSDVHIVKEYIKRENAARTAPVNTH
ncbi:hypothetical protein ABZP36_003693 [Zizania latifolia]